MLHACATSPTNPPSIAPDPLIETRTVVKTVCPPEVTAALPARPVPPEGALLEGNDAGLGWLSELLVHLGLVEGRLTDAKDQCPQ